MYLKTLHLKHFRNYSEQAVEFSAAKTILVGANAQGKSNLLESVELLATLKSHRTSRDGDLIQEGKSLSQIAATVQRQLGPVNLGLVLRQGSRRTATVHGEKLRRQLDFLGHINAVQFSSLDLELVRGGPGVRRQWLDTLLMQLEPVYAYILGQYQQALKQRNALLRQADSDGPSDRQIDAQQLALWDAQLAALGTRVMRRRARGLERLAPIAGAWHQAISGETEVLDTRYQPNVPVEQDDASHIQAAFLDKIRQRAIAEQHQHTTLVGPHRDNIDFTINGTPARQYGSQGQQRTLVLALKLAELNLIDEVIADPPLLLLDDVLAELDLSRQNQLLDAIQDRFQTLITTTHLGSFDAQWLQSSQILKVTAGQIVSE
ncbi:DNA replication and repair protein RecF [Halomicronema hongdechloris C2206]|uniref:DNA replication and repair protein RecF n=1 Tax=Halomicronema hongdechloris C2206 TaxID=1641165 RepID=A0A1Z3HQI4_9CYAN|nr:DNA replication/repair protein RecF [Halomicronema hongdechloris]ASC72522.1 DNA replication and repair protein RecF [Halomicronema hongdechloris C2206]